MTGTKHAIAWFTIVSFALPLALAAQDEDLAKQAQNPLSSLISLPFQNNTTFELGPEEDVQNVLNIQPVYPFQKGKVNVINRSILPVISMPELGNGEGRTNGLGDLNQTLWLSPTRPGKVVWGAGGAFVFPTATDDVLGSGKWSAGPSIVLLAMPGKWVTGVLAQNVWSYAGDDDRADVDSFLFQYFVNYNLANGWYLTSAPIITANWEAESDDRWLVPFGGGAGRTFRIGKRPVNTSAQVYYNAEAPSGVGDWSLRLQFQLLFPK